MTYNHSLEQQITDGTAQNIEAITTDLNGLKIILSNVNTNKHTTLVFNNFDKLVFLLDDSEELYEFEEYCTDQLISFSYEKKEKHYDFCLKSVDREITFISLTLPRIVKN